MPSDWVRQFLDLSSIHEKHELTHVRKMFQATWMSSSHDIFQRSFCGFTLNFCFQFATHTRRHHLQMKNLWKGSGCNNFKGIQGWSSRTSTQITCKVAEHEHVNVPSRIKEGLKAPKATIWRWEYVAKSKVSKTDSSYDQGAIHVRNVVECIIWHCKIHLKRIQNKHWIYKIYHEFHTTYLYIYCIYKYMYQCINNKNRNKNNNLQTHIMITKKLPQKIFFAQIPLDSSSYQWPCSDSSSRPWSLRRVSGSQRSLHSQRKTRRWRPNCLRGNFREKTVGRYL